MLAIAALLLGLAGGLAAGGRFQGLMDLKLRFEIALLAAFVVQGVARGRISGTLATSWGLWVWVVASVFLCVLLAANLRHAGVLVAAAGVLLNLLIVLANGGMPVVDSGGQALDAVTRSAGFYHLANGGTLMPYLGDAMEFSAAGAQFMLSPGDVLLLAGVASLIGRAMLAEGSAGTARAL